jgi:lysyl-tRNA synthetase class 1
MPNMEEEIKKEGLEVWAKYARVWIEKFAPEKDKFTVQKTLPSGVQNLTNKQKAFLKKVAEELGKTSSGEEFQTRIYNLGKEMGLSGKEAFAAIYISLIGKDHGPKAAWLILSLDKEFVRNRFEESARL